MTWTCQGGAPLFIAAPPSLAAGLSPTFGRPAALRSQPFAAPTHFAPLDADLLAAKGAVMSSARLATRKLELGDFHKGGC